LILFASKASAFIKRDFINEISYRFAFLLQLLVIFLPILTFFFLGELFEGAAVSHLERYGGNYFSFILIGFAFSNYLQVSISGLARSIREAQMMGTMEALLVTQTGISTIIISSSLYSFLATSIRVVIFLFIGALAFGLDLSGMNFPAALLLLVLTITSFSSLGIISASFIMMFKRGDPITWIFTGASWLLGGVYYPISVLPSWLQKFSYALPITYSLEGMRLALLRGYSIEALAPNIIALIVFSVVMLPISVLIFRAAVKKAKVDGSLSQY
jgi:ABC-2 type transport system permease protein